MSTRLITSICILASFLFISDGWATISGWTQKANFPSNGRHRGTGISIGNKGYMGLGHYNGAGINIYTPDWWQYDPSTNSWSQKADYIGNNGNGNYACLAFGMQQYGFVGGGEIGFSTEFYRYNPVTNQWTPAANSPTSLGNYEGFVIGNKGYAMTGSQLYEYNADTDQWTAKNAAPFSSSVWNSAFTIDNKGYMKAGNTLWEYKPLLDSWTSRATFPGLASGGSAAFAQNYKGYIVCGYSGWLSNVQSELWEYDPATNQWNQLPDFPGSSRRFCSGFTIGNRSFFGIGTNGTNFNDFWQFQADQVYVGIDEIQSEVHFACAPNPGVEYVRFSSDDITAFTVEIFDPLGKKIATLETTNASCTLNRDGLAAGTYVYRVLNEDILITEQRFIFN